MLKKIRLVLGAVCFALITLLFLDFTGTIHRWFGWLAKIQFLPALLAINVSIIVFLIVLTLLFGRVYCSVICPLGVFQDIIARIGKLFKKHKKTPYSYSPAISWLRYGVLGLFAIALIAGIGSLVALLAPYSSYGRIANNLFQPLWVWGNNLLAAIAERVQSYSFYETDVWLKSLPTFIIAIATLVVLVVLAGRNGRTYCNTICPVGTVLGFLAKFSWFKPVIDTSKCINCNICSRNCKAACINIKEHEIDYSRCVACMNCLGKCHQGAISYSHPIAAAKAVVKQDGGSVDQTRRGFISASALVLATSALKAQDEKKVDGGFATIVDKETPKRQSSITPPGSLSARNMARHCTGCQLCVSVCPNQVLRPSADLMKLMQPEMSYERGYCRPECVKCSEVCPTGAIKPITKEEKSSTQVGHAVWVRDLCTPLVDGVECGNCARHCPSSAIQMVASDAGDEKSVKIPVVNVERCIGCGACENLCPARPFSAIYVEGHENHKVI